MSLSKYAASGVDIDRGNRAVDLIRAAVKSTHGPAVLAGLGAFAGLLDATALKAMRDPVLAASIDGIGTKVKIASRAGRYETLGFDIVNHCTNDILVQGARPLFFLDYFASDVLDPEIIASVVNGMAEACLESGCALIGGEMAEMPGVYQPREFDVAGVMVGLVERDQILPRTNIRPGDILIGVRSSGPHTNGYSLIRKIFQDVPLETVFPELAIPLADALLEPHRSYLSHLSTILDWRPSPVKALAHITGGGLIENIPRVLVNDVEATLHLDGWPVPPIFRLIQQRGDVSTEEMHRIFNMGIGMVIVVSPEQVEAVQKAIDEETWIIGELIRGKRKVTLL